MNSLMKIALGAGAIAFLFKEQIADYFTQPGAVAVPPVIPAEPKPLPKPVGIPAVDPPAPPPPTAAVTPPPAPGSAPADIPNFSQYIANKLGKGRIMMSADSWNWYYADWSKVPQTADLFTPGQRDTEQISLTEYLYRRSQQGLSAARVLRMDPMRAWS